MSDEGDTLAPWRDWLEQHTATLRPGPVQAWTVKVRAVEVVLEVVPQARDAVAVRVIVSLPEALAGVSIASAAHALNRKLRVLTGDSELDGAVVMYVPDPTLYGAFAEPTRRIIGTLVARGVSASGGALRLEPWAAGELAGVQVADTLDAMVTLALELWLTPEAARDGIARIIERDPNTSVRETYERAFGGAADIRDARASLQAQLGLGSEERLALLARQARDKSLGLPVRQEAYERLIAEYPIDRIEEVFGDVPSILREALLQRLVGRLATTLPAAESRAAVRIIALIAGNWRALPLSLAYDIAKVIEPLAAPEALDFLVACVDRAADNVAMLGTIGLLRLRGDAREVLKRLGPEARKRLEENAPNLAWQRPALVGPLYLRLLAELDETRTKLIASSLETLAHTQREAREQGTPSDATAREQQAEVVRGFVEWGDVDVQVMAIDALAEVGDIEDLARLSALTEGFFRSGRVKDAARAALQLIMEREQVRAESGALALSEGEVGGLTLDDT